MKRFAIQIRVVEVVEYEPDRVVWHATTPPQAEQDACENVARDLMLEAKRMLAPTNDDDVTVAIITRDGAWTYNTAFRFATRAQANDFAGRVTNAAESIADHIDDDDVTDDAAERGQR